MLFPCPLQAKSDTNNLINARLMHSSHQQNNKPLQSISEMGIVVSDVPEDSRSWFNSRPFDYSVDNSRWMAGLPDNTPASLFSIPGTHNSASYAATRYRVSGKCQKWNIYEQLRAGIRYLDLRVQACLPLKMAHGKLIPLNEFREELDQIETFLNHNPSQFLLLYFQKDTGEEWDPSQKILEHFYVPQLTPHLNQGKIQAVLSTEIPTVGQLRGKVWIISSGNVVFNNRTLQICGKGFSFDCSPPQPHEHNSNIFFQNYWEVDFESHDDFLSIDEKSKRVLQTALQVESSPQRLKVNYLSGSSAYKPVQRNLYPHDLAIAEDGPNCQLNLQIQRAENRNKVLGVVVMDFPGYEMINNIISINFMQ